MKDGVYIVRGGKTYRVTNDCKCTKRTCSLYDAVKCEGEGGDQQCIRLHEIAQKFGACFAFSNFKEVRHAPRH